MSAIRRVTLPLANSLLISAVLFMAMYSLIRIQDPELKSVKALPPIQLNYIVEEEPPKIMFERLPKPKEIQATPPVERLIDDFEVGQINPVFGPEFTPDRQKHGGNLPLDNQLVIAIGFPPEYPPRAITRGIEGYAVVGFNVSAAGSVVNPFIIESEPQGVFDRSALKAISKFKYKARTVNGRAVATDGQRYMFTYQLDE